MCGIVGYVGEKSAVGIIVEGLKRLEYRGYDSAGVAVLDDAGLNVRRAVGRIKALEGVLRDVTNELSALASRGGTRLRDSGLQDTVDEVKQFARRRPGMFLLASLGAGMVIGRLGRSVDLHAVAQTAQSRGAGESPQVPPPSEW